MLFSFLFSQLKVTRTERGSEKWKLTITTIVTAIVDEFIVTVVVGQWPIMLMMMMMIEDGRNA